MLKLTKANFYKLFHTKIFWTAFIVMLILNLYFAGMNADFLTPHEIELNNGEISWWGWNFTEINSYSQHLFYMSYVVMAVVALFIGDEFSSGAIRSKILAGHSRTMLYFSYYLTSFAGMLMIHLASEIVGLAYCLIRYGTDFYGRYEQYNAAETIGVRLNNDLIFFAKLNLAAVTAIAALVGIVLICMLAVGRKAMGFATAVGIDIVSNVYVQKRISEIALYAESNSADAQKRLFMQLSADPNGFLQTLAYGDHFLPCFACCLTCACAAVAAGLVISNKRGVR